MHQETTQCSDIRIAAIARKGGWGVFLKLIGPAADRILGVRRLRLLYERYNFRGCSGHDFLKLFIKVNKIRFSVDDSELANIPKTGQVVMVGNHPLGGLEGILLAHILKQARPDYKILVNIMLYFIKELEQFFIFTNPMTPGHKSNALAIGKCRSWLRAGHALLVFPAGRVGLYREEKGYITDEAWDQSGLTLAIISKAPIVPIFVGGSCSAQFSWMCRIFYPMKLLWLVREFITSFRKEIQITVGRPIPLKSMEGMSRIKANAWLRMRTYLLAPLNQPEEAPTTKTAVKKPAPSMSVERYRQIQQDEFAIILDTEFSLKAKALIVASLLPEQFTRNKRSVGEHYYSQPGLLHREVQDYIRRYGLSAEELSKILPALDEKAPELPDSLYKRLTAAKPCLRAWYDESDRLTLVFPA